MYHLLVDFKAVAQKRINWKAGALSKINLTFYKSLIIPCESMSDNEQRWAFFRCIREKSFSKSSLLPTCSRSRVPDPAAALAWQCCPRKHSSSQNVRFDVLWWPTVQFVRLMTLDTFGESNAAVMSNHITMFSYKIILRMSTIQYTIVWVFKLFDKLEVLGIKIPLLF